MRRRYDGPLDGEIPETRNLWLRRGGEALGEVAARADTELRVDVRQVLLDRVHGDEELGGDLLVREPVGGQPSDSLLSCRQRSLRGRLSRPHPLQLGQRLLAPADSSELGEGGGRELEGAP